LYIYVSFLVVVLEWNGLEVEFIYIIFGQEMVVWNLIAPAEMGNENNLLTNNMYKVKRSNKKVIHFSMK
jgi:hypothetical protein